MLLGTLALFRSLLFPRGAPVVSLLLLRGGAVERTTVSGHRRHIWFAAVVLGALLSPPDPFSMLLVSAPIVILFELAMLVDRVMG